jgi:hypothetical protein
VARILHYDTQNVRYRRDMQRNFMDALHLVDLAAIPFVDEPPIYYPSADRWREITKLREKYKSVDLANPGSAEKKLYDALDQTVDDLNFQETPLRDVINQLKDKYDIPILADRKAFEDAGLDLDTTVVTQNVSGISLRSALRLMLGDIDLTYLIKDEVMMITTKDKAAENLVIKVYPVGDLVMPLNAGGGVNPFQTGGGMGGAGGVNSGQGGGIQAGGMGGNGMGGGMFQISDARARVARREKPDPTTLPRNPRSQPAPPPAEAGPELDDVGLPSGVLDADDIRAAVTAYLMAKPARPDAPAADGVPVTDTPDLAVRMARLRVTAAELGRQGRFDRAADLLSAAIACGRAEPWMYEALAVAMEAAGQPRAEVERVPRPRDPSLPAGDEPRPGKPRGLRPRHDARRPFRRPRDAPLGVPGRAGPRVACRSAGDLHAGRAAVENHHRCARKSRPRERGRRLPGPSRSGARSRYRTGAVLER